MARLHLNKRLLWRRLLQLTSNTHCYVGQWGEQGSGRRSRTVSRQPGGRGSTYLHKCSGRGYFSVLIPTNALCNSYKVYQLIIKGRECVGRLHRR
jgi:hypothetical protein